MLRPLALLLLAACTTTTTQPDTPSGPDPQASAQAAQKLCYVFQHVGAECRASEDLVVATDEGGTEHTLKLAATIPHAMDLPGGATRNIHYAVSLRGEPPGYTVGVVAKGTSGDDALDRGAQEWAALAGTAIVDAVRDTGRSDAVLATLVAGRRAPADATAPKALALGGFRAYPGISDFRGAVQGGPRLDHAALLEAVTGQVAGLDEGRPHSLLISMKHDGSRMTCEKAQVDGEDRAPLCAAASSFAWPAPVSPYSVRQVYMLVPGATPAAARPVPAAEAADTDGAAD